MSEKEKVQELFRASKNRLKIEYNKIQDGLRDRVNNVKKRTIEKF